MLVFILGLLFLLGMFYVKRRLDANDKRLDLLTETIQTMAGIRMEEIDKCHEECDEDDDEEEDDEEDEDEDEDEEEEAVEEVKEELYEPRSRNDAPLEIELPRREWVEEFISVENIETPVENIKSIHLDSLPDVEPEAEIKAIQLPKRTVSDDVVTEFDGLSLKELKEKVAELEGPKLKTKKECIDFLKLKSKNEV